MPPCTNCKREVELQPKMEPMEIAGVTVKARALTCGWCGDKSFAHDDLEDAYHQAALLLVERGVRTGEQFKLVRKVAGLKGTDVAVLLDVRPETVSRWERGEVDIPRAAAFALGELFERPVVTRRKLEALAS